MNGGDSYLGSWLRVAADAVAHLAAGRHAKPELPSGPGSFATEAAHHQDLQCMRVRLKKGGELS